MEIKGVVIGGGELPDKMMKVARCHDNEQTIEINVSRLTRNLLSAVANVVVDFAKDHDLNHFQCSVGIPDFVTLEKNIANCFSEHNADCLERFAKEATYETAKRVKKLAQELGIEPAKFDHLEWNKLALEESRKEREHWRPDESQKNFT